MSWNESWFIQDETDESWTDMPLSQAEASNAMQIGLMEKLINAGAISPESVRKIIDLTWDNT